MLKVLFEYVRFLPGEEVVRGAFVRGAFVRGAFVLGGLVRGAFVATGPI